MGQHIRAGLQRPVDLPSLLSSMMDGGRDPLLLRIGFDLIHSWHGRKKTKDEQSGFTFSTWLSHGRAWSLCSRWGPQDLHHGWPGSEGCASPACASPALLGLFTTSPAPQRAFPASSPAPRAFLSPWLQQELPPALSHQAGGLPAPQLVFL